MIKAKANAAAKVKTRSASAAKAQSARDGQTRRAALGALAANDTEASTYTKPKPKPKPAPAPEVAQDQGTQQQSASTARGSQVGSGEQQRSSGYQASNSTGYQQSAPEQSAPEQSAPEQSTGGGWSRALSGGTITSGFGYRWGRMHSGIDYAVSSGTPLRALNNGTVTAVGWYGGQGQRVVIRFDNGTEAHYAHMSGFSVSAGQRVGSGQTIGYSGNTGNSTGPHLHLEIHVGGSPVNPSGWLAARGIL